MPWTFRWSAVAPALALLVVTGCTTATGGTEPRPLPPAGPESAPATPQPTSPSAGEPSGTSTASVSPGADRHDVLAVYAAWWAALQAAYATGDADATALARYAVDPILSRQRASIRTLRAQRIVQRTTFTLRPRLRYRTDDYAEVEDCVRGPANTYYDAVTGTPRAPAGYRNDVPTEDRLLMTLQRRGEEWYVVAATARGEVQC